MDHLARKQIVRLSETPPGTTLNKLARDADRRIDLNQPRASRSARDFMAGKSG